MSAIRIVCAGDSLTYGHESSDPLTKSYPARMIELLGNGFEIVNAGHNGATMLGSHEGANDRSYRETLAWKKSVSQPADLVILLLGANDANPTVGLAAKNGGLFDDHLAALYCQDAKAFIDEYRLKCCCHRIWFCLSTPLYRQVGSLYDAHYIQCFQQNLSLLRVLQRQIAEQSGCDLIDTFTPMQHPEWYADGLHLNDTGYLSLARLFTNRIAQVTNWK